MEVARSTASSLTPSLLAPAMRNSCLILEVHCTSTYNSYRLFQHHYITKAPSSFIRSCIYFLEEVPYSLPLIPKIPPLRLWMMVGFKMCLLPFLHLPHTQHKEEEIISIGKKLRCACMQRVPLIQITGMNHFSILNRD